MKKEIAKKWVKALRSKKYRQARGVLKVKNRTGRTSHCCLGVLCELYQAEQKKTGKPALPTQNVNAAEIAPTIDFPATSRICEFDLMALTLPAKVRRWAGMICDAGSFRGDFMLAHRNSNYVSLSEMNDAGCKFSTIADVIEEHTALL